MNNLSLFLSDIFPLNLYHIIHTETYLLQIFFSRSPHQLENTRAATGQDADSFALDVLLLLDFLLFL